MIPKRGKSISARSLTCELSDAEGRHYSRTVLYRAIAQPRAEAGRGRDWFEKALHPRTDRESARTCARRFHALFREQAHPGDRQRRGLLSQDAQTRGTSAALLAPV